MKLLEMLPNTLSGSIRCQLGVAGEAVSEQAVQTRLLLPSSTISSRGDVNSPQSEQIVGVALPRINK